jgi:hypothetical protein
VTSKKTGDADNMQQRRREESPLAAGEGTDCEAKPSRLRWAKERCRAICRRRRQPAPGEETGWENDSTLDAHTDRLQAEKTERSRAVKRGQERSREVRKVRDDAAEGAGACQHK